MHAKPFVAAIIVAAWSAQPVPMPATHDDTAAPLPSSSAGRVLREHRYRVDARVRLLLFWKRVSNIGDGRLTWRTGADGSVGYELLVGSDPGRTPRRINRWGYLREESAASSATVFGVMSHSDEQTLEEGDRNTSRGGGAHRFKALRQVVTGSEAHITISDVRVTRDLTYADLETLLASVAAAPSRTRAVALSGWSSPGFLAAASSLMEEGRGAGGGVSGSGRFVRVYPYNGILYELELRSAERLGRYTLDERSFGPAIRARFRVRNRLTGDETPFTVVYGRDGDLADVPLLISWRPRWFLEVECALADNARR